MIIESVNIEGLNGLINAQLALNKDLNVIVGRNGSGKTSVLSLLSSIMRLDLVSMRSMPFKLMNVTIDAAEYGKIEIEAENTDESSFIQINWNDRGSARTSLSDEADLIFRRGRAQLIESVLANPRGDSLGLGSVEMYRKWVELKAEFLRISKLTFVRLDRTIVAMDAEGTESSEMSTSGLREKGKPLPSSRDPIDEVLRVTQSKYFEYRRRLNSIRAETYQDLMSLHFAPVKSTLSRRANSSQLKKKLSELRARVGSSSLTSNMPEVTKHFFESLEQLLQMTDKQPEKRAGRKSLAEESIQLMLELKEQQTEALLNIFEREQRRTQEAWEPLKNYLDILDKFLTESGKKLWFSEERLQLAFCIPAAGEKEEGEGRSLKDLSSGERQILIVLTYLAFMSGPNSIFIIDEPELSLHLRWQSYLIGALRTLRPAGGQIILATHAPEIAGRARQYCIQLSQNYLPVVPHGNDKRLS